MFAPKSRVWRRCGAPVVYALESDATSSTLFDPTTGETHFLADLPALVLSQVGEESIDLPHLLTRLDAPSDSGEEVALRVLHALATLERAELVDSVLVPEA